MNCGAGGSTCTHYSGPVAKDENGKHPPCFVEIIVSARKIKELNDNEARRVCSGRFGFAVIAVPLTPPSPQGEGVTTSVRRRDGYLFYRAHSTPNIEWKGKAVWREFALAPAGKIWLIHFGKLWRVAFLIGGTNAAVSP